VSWMRCHICFRESLLYFFYACLTQLLSCASELSSCCLFPDLHACVRCQGAWFDYVCRHFPSSKKKKVFTFLFIVVITIVVITYGIRVGSTL
jgi:hypothetical protein